MTHLFPDRSLGDLDGDGDLDLVTGNYNQVNRVYLNNNTSFSSSSPTANAKAQATTANITATFNKAMNAATSSTFIVHGRFTGKKSGSYSGSSSSTLTFDPTSDFKSGELVDVSLTTGLKATTGDAVQPARVTQFRVATTAGPAIFSNSANDIDSNTHQARAAMLGDLDADGDLDYVVVNTSSQKNSYYLSNGNGTFGSRTDVDTPGNSTAGAELGDVDGDGDLDLVVANGSTTVNRVYLGNGNGTFASGNDLHTDAITSSDISLGDLDGDGDLDAVVADWGATNKVYPGKGDGTFANPYNVDTPTNDARDGILGDVDNDGDLDYAITNDNTVNRINLNNGDGTFAAGSNIDASTLPTFGGALVDADGDGDLDFIAANRNQTNRIHLGNNDGTFAASSDIDTPTNDTRSMAVGDLDGDGDFDVVIGNYNTQTDRIYLGNGNGTFATGYAVSTITRIALGIALGDLDADGDLDMIVANSSGADRIYLNNGAVEKTTAAGLSGASTVVPGGEIQLLAIGVVSSGSHTLTSLALTLSDLTSATGLAASDFSQLRLYRSSDATFDNSDTQIGTQSTVNIGSTTTLTPSSTETITNNSQVYFIATALMNSTATDNHAFRVGFAAGGLVTSTANLGTAVTAADANKVTVAVTATQLAFTTQPAPLSLTTGIPLDFTTDPVVVAQDASGRTDLDFASTVTLGENGAGSSSFSSNTTTAVSGVATFSGVILTYTATNGDAIALTAAASGVTSATSSSIAVTAFPLLARNLVARTSEGGTVALSSDQLRFTDATSTAAQVVYTLSSTPQAGQLSKSAAALSIGGTFTQDDLDNSRVSYTHAGGEAFADGFNFTVQGSAGVATSGQRFELGINPLNDGPSLDVYQPLALAEGQQITITNGSLRVLDAEALAQQIAYAIVAPPAHGRLSLNNFTQHDIDEGRLTYRHDGGESTSDQFSFTVDDGDGAGLGLQTVQIAVAAINDPPVPPTLGDPQVAEGALLLLDLKATDPEGGPVQMTVAGQPAGATLDGTSFKWLPTYDQAGSYPLVIVYADRAGQTNRQRIDLTVVDAPVPSISPEPALLDFGSVPAGTATTMDFAIDNPTPFDLLLEDCHSSAPAFAVVQPALPLALAPDTRTDFSVRFASARDQAGTQRALLICSSGLGEISLTAIGHSLWAGLDVDQPTLDFGARVVGVAPWHKLTVSNPGNLPLDIGARLSTGPFWVEPASFALAGGQTRVLRVHFAPETVAPFARELTLSGGNEQKTITLRGEGLAPQEGRVTLDFNPAPGNQQQRTIGDARPGTILTAQLHIQRARQLAGWSARIDYDSQALSYIADSFVPGSFLRDLIQLEQIGPGYVEVGGDVLNKTPASSSGVLGTLAFRVADGFADEAELAITRLTWHRAGEAGTSRDIVYAPATIRRAPVILVQPGDFDGNGRIDLDDFFLFADRFQRHVPPAEPRFDLDDDGRVHFTDFFIFADLFGQASE